MFDKIKALKKIPGFLTPAEHQREMDGLQVKVRRARAFIGAPALVRLLREFGEVLGSVLSYDEESDPDRVTLDRLLDFDMKEGKGLSAAAEAAAKAVENVDPNKIKDFVLQTAMPALQDRLGDEAPQKLMWYVENLLPGYLWVRTSEDEEWVPIETVDEIDQLGGGFTHTLRLLYFALEVNFFPTFAGRHTRAGRSPSESEPAAKVEEGQPEEGKQTPERTTLQNFKGVKRKVGRSAPMSTTPG